jgi:Methyl-accepting chemotaxis protein
MFKSLKTKLIVICILVGLIPVFVISVIQVITIKTNITKEVKANEMSLAETNAVTIDLWLQSKIGKLEGAVKSEEFISGNKDEITKILQQMAKSDSDAVEISYSDEKGNLFTNKGENIDVSDRDYFKEVVMQKKTVVSDVIISKAANDKIIVFATPILNDKNNLTGVLCMTVSTSMLDSITKGIKIADTGYGYILSDDEVFITHPLKEERIGMNFKEVNPDAYPIFEKEVFKNTNAYVEYVASIDNTQRMAVSHVIPSTNWKIVITAPTEEVYQSINVIIKNAIIIILISISVILIISFLVASKVIKPIKGVSVLIDRTEKFDLVYDESLLWLTKGKDEIGKMVASIANMRKTLREMIGNISNSSLVVEDNSKNLSHVLEDNAGALELVAKAVDEMAHGATELAQNTQSGAEKLDVLSGEIDRMKTTSNSMMAKVSNTEQVSQKGIKIIENLQVAVKNNADIANKIGEKVFKLSDKSQSISNITEAINDITSQINLLSLNAAIESARAGEAGKGFAVVANEIKNLALNTSVSTKEISEIIQEFKDITEEAKGEMVDAKSTITATDNSAKETMLVFNEINMAIQEMTKEIKNLLNAIDSVDKNKNVVVSDIEDISAVSEESASTSQEISASVEEQSSRMEQISESASELTNIAVKLKDLVSRFKL